MNEQRLYIYLEDHLALIVGEVELIERCHSSNQHSELGRFLKRLQGDVERQKAVVEDILRRLGRDSSVSGKLKQGAAWFAEKLGRFKLNDSLLEYSDLSRVVELEGLMAAIYERIALWTSLDAVINSVGGFEEFAFASLREQSEGQLEELKSHHRSAIQLAFSTDD
jgi:hypothetical protein